MKSISILKLLILKPCNVDNILQIEIKKISKEKLISHLNLTLRFSIFAIVSILLGKIILYFIF